MTAFTVNEFYQRNRRVAIWVILFALLQSELRGARCGGRPETAPTITVDVI
jgi:hypothetical protein